MGYFSWDSGVDVPRGIFVPGSPFFFLCQWCFGKVVSNGVCLRSCVYSGAFVLARSQPLVLGSVVFFPFVRFSLHRLWTISLAFCMAYM